MFEWLTDVLLGGRALSQDWFRLFFFSAWLLGAGLLLYDWALKAIAHLLGAFYLNDILRLDVVYCAARQKRVIVFLSALVRCRLSVGLIQLRQIKLALGLAIE